MEKSKKEELQSCRDFLKKAAKSALPIFGAILLYMELAEARAWAYAA